MKIHRETSTNRATIDNYGSGYVTISGKQYRESVMISGLQVTTLPELLTPSDLTFDSTRQTLDASPEVVLLGTGPKLEFPDLGVIKAFHAQGVGCDIMDSGAACRTYNILASEGRAVAVILLMP